MSFDVHAEQGKWRQWDKFFDKVLVEHKPEGFNFRSALVIGCATGWSARALSKHFDRVVGVDADRSLIETAKAIASHLPTGNKLVFEHAENLEKYDAFGEQFDLVFSAYTLAYLGDVTNVLRQWAALIRPGGMLIVREIQGLFAVHSPLNSYKSWFEKFDKDTLRRLGYNSTAGAQMGDAVLNISELKTIAYLDWEDAELSFNGPLSTTSPVWLGWEARWKRLWPLMNENGPVEEGLHDAFFSCLTSPEHTCEKPVKVLICEKLVKVRTVSTSIRDESADNSRLSPDVSFPGESGGGDGD